MKMKILLDAGAKVPARAHDADAGYDLYAAHNRYIPCRSSMDIDTGVHIEIPPGYYGAVVGRSGLNFKNDIICPTGTIDSGYSGSIKVKLYNLSGKSFTIAKGDRIAQIIFKKCETADFEIVNSLESTERGSGGFGSTGV